MKKKNSVGLWIAMIWILVSISTVMGSNMLFVMIPLLVFVIPVVVVVSALKKVQRANADDSSSDFPSSTSSAPPVSNANPSTYGQAPRSQANFNPRAAAPSSGQNVSNYSDDSQYRMEELQDLLKAGIIELEEYRDRMQDLRQNARR